MEFHPLAELFPLMPDNDRAALGADILANGLREEIWTHEEKIIDGRNRYLACKEVGVEPRYRQWNGEGSLLNFVVSLNLNRRHLDESQRAMVASKLANIDPSGRRLDPLQNCGVVSQGLAAQMLNVSTRLVSSARKVRNDGVPELAKKVEAGEISVSAAAPIAELPKGKQKRLIKRGRKAQKKLLTSVKVKSLQNTEKGFVSCLHCSPVAKFEPDTISAFLQKLQHRALEFARSNGTHNYAVLFQDAIDELGDEAVRASVLPAAEKILAAIDRGTMGDEVGLLEKSDALRITKLPRSEFDAAITYLLDYRTIEIVKMEGKQDTARGGRKDLLRRVAVQELTYEPDPDHEGDEKDVYIDSFSKG